MYNSKKIEYPNLSVEEAIRCVKVLIEKLDGGAQNVDAYAHLIGHKSAKSGTFIIKLGDLRKFGLLEPRGKPKVTPLAKKLIHPKPKTEEKQEAINAMILNVGLWRVLYKKIGKNYPSDSEFWVYLMEALNLDRNEAIKYADSVRKKYKEVMGHYKEIQNISKKELIEKENSFPSKQEKTPESQNSLSSKCIEARVGDIYIRFPRNKESALAAKKLLEILELQISEE